MELRYFPMNQNYPYDRYGQVYNVSRVLDSSDRFNLTTYKEYSLLYLPATYVMTYLFAFALSICVFIHTILYHGLSLWKGIKKIHVEQDDIHAKLMRNYPEVPDWWYVLSFVGFYCMMVLVVEVSHIDDLGSCMNCQLCRFGIHRYLFGRYCCRYFYPCYTSFHLASFLP